MNINWKKTYLLYSICAYIIVLLTSTTAFLVSAAEITDKQSIKIIQATLNAEGFDCGTPDGIVGKRTKAAVEKYQREKELTVTGIISDELTESLGLSADMLKGVLFSEFVSRYNEGAVYCNNISDETGDPKISQIDESVFEDQAFLLDNNMTVSFLEDDRKVSVRGIILSKSENSYDIPAVYEIVSSVYALDSSFSDMASVIDFVGNYIENYTASTGKMSYSVVKRGETIYFAIIPS